MSLSIRWKLALLWSLGSLAPIVAILAIVGWSDTRALSRQMLAADQSVAAIVSEYASAAIIMEDAEAAAQDLAVMGRLEHAMAAALYEPSGALFAVWQRPGTSVSVPERLEAGQEALGLVEREDSFQHIRPVMHEGKEYGRLLLIVSKKPVTERVEGVLVGLCVAGGVSLVLAFTLSLLLQRMVSSRITGLAEAARHITRKADYGLRVPEGGKDEIGTLAEAFNQMLEEIGRRQQEAEAAIRLRDEFILVAAHELKTPLASLGLSLQLFERAQSGGRLRPEALHDVAESALRQTKRLQRLVATLLDVASLSAGMFRIAPQEADLVTIVRDVAKDFEHDAAKAGCTLDIVVPESAKGRWDPLRLEQLVANLLSNALKYGSGKPVLLSVEADATCVRLRVKDHGIGIAPEDTGRVFGRFERAVPVSHYGGLGLGLHIAQGIVQAHGGTITVESQSGQGTVFTVVLPRETPFHESSGGSSPKQGDESKA